jgi:hypothetical protein
MATGGAAPPSDAPAAAPTAQVVSITAHRPMNNLFRPTGPSQMEQEMRKEAGLDVPAVNITASRGEEIVVPENPYRKYFPASLANKPGGAVNFKHAAELAGQFAQVKLQKMINNIERKDF